MWGGELKTFASRTLWISLAKWLPCPLRYRSISEPEGHTTQTYQHVMRRQAQIVHAIYVFISTFSVLYCMFLLDGTIYARTFGEAARIVYPHDDTQRRTTRTAIKDDAPKTCQALWMLAPALCENGENSNAKELAQYEVTNNNSVRWFRLYALKYFCQHSYF